MSNIQARGLFGRQRAQLELVRLVAPSNGHERDL